MAALAVAHNEDMQPLDAAPAAEENRTRLRLGVFTDSLRQPRWAVEALCKTADAGIADVAVVVELGKRPDRVPLSWRAYCSLDRLAFGSHPDPLETIDLRAVLPHGRLLCLPASSAGPASARAWLAEIGGLNLDVAFVLGDIDDRTLEGIARYGVWRYCFGADAAAHDAVAGIHEVAEAMPVTASGLRVHLGAGSGDRLAYQSWSRVFPFSVTRTRENLLPKTSEFARRALAELRRSGPSFLDRCATISADSYRTDVSVPGPTRMLRHMSLLGPRIARRILEKILCVDQWFLAYRFGADEPWQGDLRRYTRLLPPKDRFWADPFPICRQGRYFVFLEELVFSRGKAHISVMEIGSDGTCTKPAPVLERPYHLSYPFLLEHEGELYMIPETGANRTVELYRCASFPDRWELVRVLMHDVRCTDATLHRIGDRWWMFANTNLGDSVGADELNLFYADDLFGKWRAHRNNPVKSDVRGTRPAGRLYESGGALYRPAQVGAPMYGSAVSINRILELDPNTYAEREVERIAPTYPKRVLGIHTLNRAGGLCVMDAFTRRVRL
jgi:hypothetical protein